MKITIGKKYLVFPINTNGKNKYLQFFLGGRAVYELNLKLDRFAPDFRAYIDVSRYLGETLELIIAPEMEIPLEQADRMELPGVYGEALRPQVHFSAKNGWINDPNGLIYLDGVYHLFYQYNPAGNNWDNMHWGHAVSGDLIRWEERDVAMFVGEQGNIFSGSAIVDRENRSGLAEGENPAVLLYYTATGRPFTQRLAYSTDGLQTIREYPGNPVVPHLEGANRDPKVVFCEELRCYVMALFLINNRYALLSSEDLKEWRVFQELDIPNEAECPDLFPIRDGKGRKKWVLMGASDHYLVGEFREGAFVPCQEVRCLQYGSGAYAGQSFSGLPGDRVVRVCWDRWDHPSTSFTGQMGIPLELSLEEEDGGFFLRAAPVKELKGLFLRREVLEGRAIAPGAPLRADLEERPYFWRLRGAYAEGVVLEVTVFGCRIQVDFSRNQLSLGGKTMPVSARKDGLDLAVISDRHSVEIFADGGRGYLVEAEEAGLWDPNLPWLVVAADGEYRVEEVELCPMGSIWENC